MATQPLSFNEWMKSNAYYCNQSSIAEKYARYVINFNKKKQN